MISRVVVSMVAGALALVAVPGLVTAQEKAAKPLHIVVYGGSGNIRPGTRTGKFRLGGEQLVTDPQGRSAISMEDYAVAMLDEIEKPQYLNNRFTVGY